MSTPLCHLSYSIGSLTFVRTQAPFLVLVIVCSGTAPQLAVCSALTGAGVILFAEEDEGEVAELSLRIPTDDSRVCSRSQKSVSAIRLSRTMPLFILFSVAYLCWDKSQTSCPGRSSLWWHTSGIRLCGPLKCSCHIPCPKR